MVRWGISIVRETISKLCCHALTQMQKSFSNANSRTAIKRLSRSKPIFIAHRGRLRRVHYVVLQLRKSAILKNPSMPNLGVLLTYGRAIVGQGNRRFQGGKGKIGLFSLEKETLEMRMCGKDGANKEPISGARFQRFYMARETRRVKRTCFLKPSI